MKKLFISLGLGALLLGGSVFGQNARKVIVSENVIKVKEEKKKRFLDEEFVPVYSAPATNNTGMGIVNSQRTAAFNPITIGTSANVFSIIDDGTNQTFVMPSLNVVGFTHRNNSTNFPASGSASWASGLPRFDLSTDGGAQWSVDLGPLMVDDGIGNLGNLRPRYPQGVLLPTGTAIADLRLVATSTAWVNNTSSGNYVDWGWGLRMLAWDIGSFTAAQVDDPFSNTSKWFTDANAVSRYDGGVEQSLCWNKDANGNFHAWVVNDHWTTNEESKDTIYIIRGDFDANQQSMTWTIQQKIKVGTSFGDGGYARMSTPVIEFSPDGQYGWIGFGAHLDHDGNPNNIESFWGQNAIFYKSTDYGQTWTGPIEVDLTQFLDLIGALKMYYTDPNTNQLDSTSQIPVIGGTGSVFDITVDANGNPHFFCAVFNHGFDKDNPPQQLADLNSYFIVPKVMVDITTPNQGQTWNVILIDTLYYSQWKQSDPPDQYDLGEWGWAQVGRSADGNVIGYVYINDTSAQGNNTTTSNVWSAGFRLTDSTFAKPVGHSNGSSHNGIVFWPQLSPIFLPGNAANGEYILPIAYTTETAAVPSNGTVQWYYSGDVRLDNSRFTSSPDIVTDVNRPTKEVAFVAYPNPVRNEVTITAPQIKGTAIIEVNDIQGRKLIEKSISANGRVTETLDMSKLPQGIYFIKVTTSEATGVVKIIKD